MLALPGSAYLYQGEELGLPEVTDLPDDVRQDPVWQRSEHRIRGRDGCRVPLPWTTGPGFGFTGGPSTWLPQPGYFGDYAVSAQEGREDSTLSLYRRALRLRRELDLGHGALTWESDAPGLVAFGRGGGRVLVLANLAPGLVACGRGRVLVLANLSAEPQPLPAGATVLLASQPVTGHLLPVDTAVWLELSSTDQTPSHSAKETR
jgi:alpha-glucosidase